MFRRGLAVLLCSALLAGSLPETSFAAENAETVETAETDTTGTEEAEPEKQENNASTESEETVQASQTAVPETQTVSGTEKTETEETTKTTVVETTEASEASTTEVKTDASEETTETVTQTETATAAETETASAVETETATQTETASATETETVTQTETTSATETETVSETETASATETESVTETETVTETEEATTEVETEEETTEVETEEIENADENTEGNEYIAISNVKVTYNSISFDYEVKKDDVQYVRISGADGFSDYWSISGKGSRTINNLKPSTEYQLAFTEDAEGISRYYVFSKTTAEYPFSVSYDATSSAADQISLTAKITAKEGAVYELPYCFKLYWKLFDKDGTYISSGSTSVYPDNSLPEITTVISDMPEYLFAETEYKVELWLEDGSYDYGADEYVQYAKDSKNVTTAKSPVSDVTVEFKQDASDASVSNYTLTTGDYKDSVDGTLFWRIKGNGTWDYTSFNTTDGSSSGSIYNLSIGATYEWMVNAAGFKKTDEFTNGEATLKWNAEYDMGALDAVITFALNEASKAEGATYEIKDYHYKKHASTDMWNDLERDDGKYIARNLLPNTQYDIEFIIREELPNGNTNTYTAFTTETTKASAVKIKIAEQHVDGVRFQAAFADSVRAEYAKSVRVSPYIKGEDGKYTPVKGDNDVMISNEIEDDEDYDFWDYSYISGLESNKIYEISLGELDYDDGSYYEYGTMTFKTAADNRAITIDTPEVGVTNVRITGTVQGNTALNGDGTQVVMLYRESGTTVWKYATDDYANYENEWSFELENDLEAGKTYEYAVGIAPNYDKMDYDSLKSVKKGTIKTRPDERSVAVTETVSLLNGLAVKAKLTGKYIDEYNSYTLFYREKGATTWANADSNRLAFEEDSRETSTIISEYSLTSGTTYEYKLYGGYGRPKKEEDYAALPGGEFTYTKPTDDRKADATVTASRRNSAELNVTLTGSVRAIDNYITLLYREKGTTSWNLAYYDYDDDNYGYAVPHRRMQWNETDPTRKMSISGLSAGKEYEYAVVVSSNDINSAPNNTEKTGEFTTTDTRKFAGEPAYTADYKSVNLSVDVEGFTEEGSHSSSYIYLYYKEQNADQQNTDWSRYSYPAHVYSDGKVTFNSISVEQDKTYDFALVIADSTYNAPAPGSDAYDKLSADKKKTGTFAAKKSPYTLTITPNAEKTTYNKGVLDLTVTSTGDFDEKNFRANLYVMNSTTNDYVASLSNISINSVDKKGEAVINGLVSNTKYKVYGTLYAYVAGDPQPVAEIPSDKAIEFSTLNITAPTSLELSEKEIWLNNWSQYPDRWGQYRRQTISVVKPEGAANSINWSVTWSSSNPDVASVYGGTIYAEAPGDAVITATSTENPNVTATVTVHVGSYGAYFTNTGESVFSVWTEKNTHSKNVKYGQISAVANTDGTISYRATPVNAKGTSDNPNIAYWDEAQQWIVAKNIGSTYITLTTEDGNYKMKLNVGVYVADPNREPDFDLRITDYNSSYPAIKTADGYQIAVGQGYDLYAEANPEVDYDISSVLKYTISETDKSILRLDSDGYIEGLKKGTATVTVSYDTDRIKMLAEYYPDNMELQSLAQNTTLGTKTKTVKFDVRKTTSQGLPETHAITNVHKTLSQALGTLGEGWKLLDPDTPLYTLPVNENDYSYEFEAEYTGNDYYPYKGKVRVYLSTIAGVDVINNGSSVISSDGSDAMNVVVKPIITGYTGLVEGEDYKVTLTSPKTEVKVEDDTAGFKITASKKGKYTLKAEVTNKDGNTVLASGSYTVTVADGTLIDHIDLDPSADSEHVTIKGNTIYFDSSKINDVKNFTLTATAYDRKEAVNTDTKLTWTITDKSVADVKADATGRTATVNIKGEGHAVIQVTAGDEAKASTKFNVEVRNYKPRVEGADKVTINTAYDYSVVNGRRLSYSQYGNVSVTAVYSDSIKDIQVMDSAVEDGATAFAKISDKFKISTVDNSNPTLSGRTAYVLVSPVNADESAGKHSVYLGVKTASGFVYSYPLTVTVMNKKPKVTAKVSNNMNLFYLNSVGHLDITLEKNKSKNTDFGIERVAWAGSSDGGFKLSDYGYLASAKTLNVMRYNIDGSKVKVSNGKPAAVPTEVNVKLYGVREPYTLKIGLKTSYKKPKLTTSDIRTKKNTSVLIPSLSAKSFAFYILGDKKTISYNELRINSDIKKDVTIDSHNPVSVSYSGTAEKFDLPLTIDSFNWREALTVTHKVATTKPIAVLSNAKLTYNTNYDSAVRTAVSLKDYYGDDNISAVDVAGADQTSHNLLTSGTLQTSYIGSNYYGGYILQMNLNTSRLGTDIPKAATYVLTPYCNGQALNTLTLKISFTDKPITAKASGKGKLDLAVSDAKADYYPEDFVDYDPSDDTYQWLTSNSIAVAPKFANLGSGYYIIGAELTGEYSDYFNIYRSSDSKGNSVQYIKISRKGVGKLKAGQNYNLSVIYTLEDADGNQITVQSNVLKIKPIQKAPKITIIGDNQILYAAAPSVTKTTTIRTPYGDTELTKDYYMIESAYGSLDTNKDGKADIVISSDYSESGYDEANLTVRLTDKDAVITAAKGKTYTVPVTVKLVGRDGISKDATIKIKVTVKR